MEDKKRPGQGDASLAYQVGVMAEQLKALTKVVGQSKPIDIQFSWPMDHELMKKVDLILDTVKSIRHAQAEDSVTKSEIEEILGPVLARMKAVP